MLTIDEGKHAVVFARTVIEHYVKHTASPTTPSLPRVFDENHGVFVTLHTHPYHDLRGCIGIPLPVMTLQEAIIESAQSATRDPRFPPLHENELDSIIIEVTILTKPTLITVKQPREYLTQIEIGRDGLIVEQGIYKGLLLPQVPIEQGWGKEEFLSHTCMKAGVLPDAWYEKNTKIFKFSGQIFTETIPRKDIKEKQLDGSHN
ncbi:MAG: TIGR00296 family protein [Methanobacteriota archaeon]